ncbi:unnamed protein product [Anisakis simplex]|uniref:Ubiq_cyt_C_chap domain-containing protein n=1 Tax=Anisakis simplex TaxID=6269 RepID=A0A0M3K5Q5_ANISI|nr:unnamed protein product [Anisakis simplex]
MTHLSSPVNCWISCRFPLIILWFVSVIAQKQYHRSLRISVFYRSNLQLLDRAAAQLYYDCANNYPYVKLCEAFGLPDYASTWFKLTIMHIWMVLMRLHVSLEVHSYIRLQRSLLAVMWMDVDKRLEVIGKEIKQSLTSYGDMKHMHGLHLQTLLEYDEGYLSDDTVLAGAIWRCLYLQRSYDPIYVNRVILYIRSTMAYLDSLDLNDILVDGIKEWKTMKPTVTDVKKFDDCDRKRREYEEKKIIS